MNLKLNGKKLKFKMDSVPYMGHLLTRDGVKPDPRKIEAITQMPRPENPKAILRLLGSVNYLSRFLPKLSEAAEPLRRLTKNDVPWHWESHQENAYQEVLKLMATAPVLKYYDVTQEVTIQADSSEKGLGAVLLQNGQPVTFASRALSPVEGNYAQIEKEMLAIVFACERFDHYLHGKAEIKVETDHKPLVTIMQKSIHQAPKRLQRMLMRLQKYAVVIYHKPGKEMYISDMLSRAYLPAKTRNQTETPYHIFLAQQEEQENKLYHEIEEVNQPAHMNLKEGTQEQIQKATQTDPVMQELASTVLLGWPEARQHVSPAIRAYWNYRDELTVFDGIIYKGMKVVIPKVLRKVMVEKAHSSHTGQACVRRARDVIFWPGMKDEIEARINECDTCCEYMAKQQKEPLMSHKIPSLPWEKVGQDIFSLHGHSYLVTVDYYSDYFELDFLEDTTANTVIEKTKAHFARHGIADICSDNGPQFTSQEFANFAAAWEFTHSTSSPLHSQSNGKAESAVKIAKRLVKKCKRDGSDLQKALLDWRNTPDKQGFSPVQKLMSRRTRTTLPTAQGQLLPSVIRGVPEMIKKRKQVAKFYYDRSAKELPELEYGDSVRLQPDRQGLPWKTGTCIGKVCPRSYLIQTDTGVYRRNSRFIRRAGNQDGEQPLTEKNTLSSEEQQQEQDAPIAVSTQEGESSSNLTDSDIDTEIHASPETNPQANALPQADGTVSQPSGLGRDRGSQAKQITTESAGFSPGAGKSRPPVGISRRGRHIYRPVRYE